jgi:hypothetical protein
MIVGTNALYAYEGLAGVRIESGMIATVDVDVLWDSRKQLVLSIDLEERGFVGLLRKIDKSFERAIGGNSSFRARNNDGYAVDLLTQPQPYPPHTEDLRMTPLPDDLRARALTGQDWLLQVPQVRAVVIDTRGFPAEMIVPDPRLWALHKIWLSRQLDRGGEKRTRDSAQAKIMGMLLADRLAHYPVDSEILDIFPGDLRRNLPELPIGM